MSLVFSDEDRAGLRTNQAIQNGYVCPSGAYCSGQQGTNVGNSGTIFHRTTTTVVKDDAGKIKGSNTDVYILSSGKWVRAASTTDGGQKYTFNEETRADGTKIVGADLRKSFAPGGNMNKNVKAQTVRTLTNGGADLTPAPKLTPKEQADAGYTSPPAEVVDLEDVQSTTDAALNELNQIDSIRRTQYGNWKYPIDFPRNQDRIKFTMIAYSPRSFDVRNVATGASPFGDRLQTSQEKEIRGSVTLPISPTINDQNTVSWGSDELNAIAAVAAASSLNIITKGPGGVEQDLDAIAKGLLGSAGAIKTAAGVYLAGQAAGGNKNFLSRVTGSILNPNLELLFNGPQLRTFSFSFMLSAREPDESKEIRNIIRFFKQGMSVKRATTNLFLKAPNIFNISYQLAETNQDHPWINKIKTCALTNCSVNYTPAGNYATFYDGAMTAYELTLSFSELDPIFDNDYDNPGSFGTPDTSIGY